MAEKYTKELLTEVAAASKSVTEMLRRMVLPIIGGTHAEVTRQVRRAGIDTSHFTTTGIRPMLQSYSADFVAKTAAESKSIEDLAVALSLSSRSNSCDKIRAFCAEAGINVSHLGVRIKTAQRRNTHTPTDTVFTRELLLERTPQARNLSDLLRQFDVEPTTTQRRHITAQLQLHGIDFSHFKRGHVRYPREALEEAVAASLSYAGVLRYFNVPLAGGTHAHLSRRIKAMGIDTSHFTGQAHNKGKRSLRRLRPDEVLTLAAPGSRRTPGEQLRRALRDVGRPINCEWCGAGEVWHGRKMTLEVDHINGNWLDNTPANLRIMCPNCHSTTDTYCGRSKNTKSRRS
jgi:hypothetical protein